MPSTANWLPIDTAPKDGTWVLLKGGEADGPTDDNWAPTKPTPMVVAFWDTWEWQPGEGHWAFAYWDMDWYSEYKDPTHWMPLPSIDQVRSTPATTPAAESDPHSSLMP